MAPITSSRFGLRVEHAENPPTLVLDSKSQPEEYQALFHERH